jgi:hypothetical protein
MIEDADRPAGDAQRPAANDNGGNAAEPIDPRILTIACAIGRLIAREQFKAANDNGPPRRGKK